MDCPVSVRMVATQGMRFRTATWPPLSAALGSDLVESLCSVRPPRCRELYRVSRDGEGIALESFSSSGRLRRLGVVEKRLRVAFRWG